MNALPTWEARKLLLDSIAETMRESRLSYLYRRANRQGHSASIVPAREEYGPFLSVLVSRDGRRIGSIRIESPSGEQEETASLSVDCDDVMTGLPMQSDWLVENAKLVRDAFRALLEEPSDLAARLRAADAAGDTAEQRRVLALMDAAEAEQRDAADERERDGRISQREELR